METDSIISLVWLLIGGLFLYQFLSFLLVRNVFNVQDLFKEKVNQNKSRMDKQIVAKGLAKWIYPESFLNECRKYNWQLTVQRYWLFVLGTGAILTALLFFMKLGPFSILGFIGGFFAIKLMQSFYKNKYQREIEEALISYMKAVSNAIPTTDNVISAVQSVLPMLKKSIRSDVEYSISLLSSGLSVEESFKPMNDKYEYQDLEFFHNMLSTAYKNGTGFYDILSATADEFEHKKVLQAKLNANMAQARRAFTQNACFLILIIVGARLFVSDIFDLTFSNFMGRVVLIGIVIITVYSYWQVRKHSEFNPIQADKK